mgnify:CR=1 FL=1
MSPLSLKHAPFPIAPVATGTTTLPRARCAPRRPRRRSCCGARWPSTRATPWRCTCTSTWQKPQPPRSRARAATGPFGRGGRSAARRRWQRRGYSRGTSCTCRRTSTSGVALEGGASGFCKLALSGGALGSWLRGTAQVVSRWYLHCGPFPLPDAQTNSARLSQLHPCVPGRPPKLAGWACTAMPWPPTRRHTTLMSPAAACASTRTFRSTTSTCSSTRPGAEPPTRAACPAAHSSEAVSSAACT